MAKAGATLFAYHVLPSLMARKDDRLTFVSYPKLTKALKAKAKRETEGSEWGAVTMSDVIRRACEKEVGL